MGRYRESETMERIGTTCKNMTSEQIRVRYEMGLTTTDLMLMTPAKYGTVTFKTLKIFYAEKGYHLDEATFEENLNLRTPDGKYNLLAELLSDRNTVPLIVVKFRGRDKTAVSERNDYGSQCLLFCYERIKNRLTAENICLSDTTVRPRRDRFLFDFDCVNEALINALVHNDWNISQPLISLFSDRLEILSHGGLPKDQTKEDFFRGISKPRNDMLMRIFLNMELTEHTGHGVPIILSKYGEAAFDIHDTYINVTIPYDPAVLREIGENRRIGTSGRSDEEINEEINEEIKPTERDVLYHLAQDPSVTIASLTREIGVSKSSIERALHHLQEKGQIVREGSRKTGCWTVVKQPAHRPEY